MGAYAYCQHCDSPLGPPSAREVVEQRRECPHCGKYNEVYDTMADVIERLEGRIEELGEAVKVLTQKAGDPSRFDWSRAQRHNDAS